MKLGSIASDSLRPHGLAHGILQARILEWVAFHFSRGSSQPRDPTQVSRIAGGFFTSWATREAQECWSAQPIPSPADLPDSGIEPGPPALQEDSLPTELPGRLYSWFYKNITSPFMTYCDFVFIFWEILYILDFFGFVYLKIFLSQNLEKIIWKSLNKILQPWYY